MTKRFKLGMHGRMCSFENDSMAELQSSFVSPCPSPVIVYVINFTIIFTLNIDQSSIDQLLMMSHLNGCKYMPSCIHIHTVLYIHMMKFDTMYQFRTNERMLSQHKLCKIELIMPLNYRLTSLNFILNITLSLSLSLSPSLRNHPTIT